MAIIEFHFAEPQSIIGNIICWRTGDQFSHSWVVLDDVMYNPLPLKSTRHEPASTIGDKVLRLIVSEEDFIHVRKWCEDWVGTKYDFLGIFGWLIGVKELQHPNHTYCHEFCHKVMSMVSDVPSSHKLISADHLINELTGLGAVVIVG